MVRFAPAIEMDVGIATRDKLAGPAVRWVSFVVRVAVTESSAAAAPASAERLTQLVFAPGCRFQPLPLRVHA